MATRTNARRHRSIKRAQATLLALASIFVAGNASATEGALGRPVAGTSVLSGVGIVPTEPVWIASLQTVYLDGSIGASRPVPIGGQTSLGLNGELSLTLASLLKVWGSYGGWAFASGITLPYIWEKVTGSFATGQFISTTSDRASNLYDMLFTPIEAGYQISETDHIALSFNIWAPTGNYEAGALANPSLNNWTFVPTVAYTKLVPKYGLEFDAVMGFQFYTRNTATNYQNAPLFTLDVMGLKKFANGFGMGVVMGTVQQLGNDTGPTADRLNGFVGHDFTVGPIVTYETKIGGKAPLSASVRWVPSVTSTNRLKSTKTFMATATLVF
ncbi:meta-pathway phenol degradation-like protein [Caballeronia calidae]|uniref:Meta-pathway phenol degradation-like protein n=1 Tax=Caballeronia calidae TaxID=1777139 RepID=A0A158BGG8_9BURK|nr:transporter [Caballeronia calidae]SAK69152.1 meta-pathway phenol degradation-like protein [Caballeronia calidae]